MYEQCSAQEFGEGGLAVCRPMFACGSPHRPSVRRCTTGPFTNGRLLQSETIKQAHQGGIYTVTTESDDLWSRIWAPLLDTDVELSHPVSELLREPVNGHGRNSPSLTQERTCPAPFKRHYSPSIRSRLTTHTTRPRTRSNPLPAQDLPEASTCAHITNPFKKVIEAIPITMNNQYITPTIHSGLRAMPNTLLLAPISTTSVTKTVATTVTNIVDATVTKKVAATVTSTITRVISATPRLSMTSGLSTECFHSLICRACTAVAHELGLPPFDMQRYMPFIHRLVTALVMGSTAGGAFLYGRHLTLRTIPRPTQDEQLQRDIQDATDAQAASEQILLELTEARERIAELEKQETRLQLHIHKETLHREIEEAKVRKLKKATGTIGTQNTPRPRMPFGSSSPKTPIQQEIRNSYKDVIEANTDRLMSKDITADEIYEQVSSGYTPPSSRMKRKLVNDDDEDPMNTAKARLMDTGVRAQQASVSPPQKLDFGNLPKLLPVEESSMKRVKVLVSKVAVEGAPTEPARSLSPQRSPSPRRSPRKHKKTDMSERSLDGRSLMPSKM